MCNFITKLSFSYALLCVGKEVPRNPPALHAGPLRFFTLKGYNVLAQKSLAKNGFAIWSLRGVKLPFGVLFLGSIEIRNMQTVSDD